MAYARHFDQKNVPQSQPLPDRTMVKNAAGGYAFEAENWRKLNRFLMIGTEGGTYYEGERPLTLDNAKALEACIQENGQRVVSEIVRVSTLQNPTSNSPAIFALALVFAKSQSSVVRYEAQRVFGRVIRTGSHLLEFMATISVFRRSGGSTVRRAVENWFNDQEPRQLAYQVTKYQNREGWTMRDVLRMRHVKADGSSRQAVLHYIMDRLDFGDLTADNEVLQYLVAVHNIKSTTGPLEAAALIRNFSLPREVVPTQLLNSPEVWMALLESMPYTATLRNLGKMSSMDMFAPFSDALKIVTERLVNPDSIRHARVSPLSILLALKTYRTGHGFRGSLTWTPAGRIVDALDAAFYAAFDNVEKLDKNIVVAIDASGSMTAPVAGLSNLSAREAGVATALVYLKANPQAHVLAFTDHIHGADFLSPGMRLDQALAEFDRRVLPIGTDCNQPFNWALQRNIPADGFLMITDSESWAGNRHAVVGIDLLRKQRPTKWVVVQTTASGTLIQDPKDTDAMEMAGFAPSLIDVTNEFFKGNL